MGPTVKGFGKRDRGNGAVLVRKTDDKSASSGSQAGAKERAGKRSPSPREMPRARNGRCKDYRMKKKVGRQMEGVGYSRNDAARYSERLPQKSAGPRVQYGRYLAKSGSMLIVGPEPSAATCKEDRRGQERGSCEREGKWRREV